MKSALMIESLCLFRTKFSFKPKKKTIGAQSTLPPDDDAEIDDELSCKYVKMVLFRYLNGMICDNSCLLSKHIAHKFNKFHCYVISSILAQHIWKCLLIKPLNAINMLLFAFRVGYLCTFDNLTI